jgi:hypothetical protein
VDSETKRGKNGRHEETRTPDLCHIKVPFNSETFGVVRNSQKLLTDPPHRPTEMLEFPPLASFPDRIAARSTAGNFLLLTDHQPTSPL